VILVLGVGIVGKAVLNYFKDKRVCFFDDKIKFFEGMAFFDPLDSQSWAQIRLVVASPGFALKHDIIQEAIRRQIPITNDIGIFLNQRHDGIKIGITGTNGKSTTCALLKHVLGDNALVGGNFGISPLDFGPADFYILELSSYQLELLEKDELSKLEIGVIVNIYPNHLARHGSFNDYISAKCRIFSAKHKILGFCPLFENWDLPKAKIPENLPNSPLFDKQEYKYCWGIIEMILEILGLDIEKARQKAANYKCLTYRQEDVAQNPIRVINDSKSSNSVAAKQALANLTDFVCWMAGGAGTSDWSDFERFSGNIKKVIICGDSNSQEELVKICTDLGLDFEIFASFEEAVQVGLKFSIENRLTFLFSPGYQSFDKFQNFEHRGQIFNELIAKFLES